MQKNIGQIMELKNRMKRIKVKEGDVFKIRVSEKEVGFFQYLLLDPCQLNSEVIRVFNFRGNEKDKINLELIFSSGIDFYSHVIIKSGIRLGLWNKVENYPIEKDFDAPYFRDTFGHDDEYEGNKIIYKKSNSWNIWQAGYSFDSRKNIGFLSKEYELIDIGIVYSPNEVIHRMLTGKYSYPYYS